ncbi:MAG: pyrroline-5-carboxylate reductase [Oscillospiraceae bacterium]
MTLGFVGAGNMAGAIFNGVLGRHLLSAESIWLSNRSAPKLEAYAVLGAHTTTDNVAVVQAADVIVLAIKPQMFPDVLPGIAPYASGKCFVSIAAGISVDYLKSQLPGALVMRAMPNTPMQVGLGATGIVAAPEVPAQIFNAVSDIFAAGGEIAVITEAQIDDIIALSGSTPAFFFRMADALVSCAVQNGFDPDLALKLAAKTMEGSAVMLQKSGKTAKELTRQVCSPGGTTLAALTAFDEQDFEGMITEAVTRCTARSKELSEAN